jgi:hypothetical protein
VNTESFKVKSSDYPDKQVSERIRLPRAFRMLPLNGIKEVHQHWQDENTRRLSEAADVKGTHRRRIPSRHHPSTSNTPENMHDLNPRESEAARLDGEFNKLFDFGRIGVPEPEPEFEERVCRPMPLQRAGS